MTKILASMMLSFLTLLASGNCDGATVPNWTCVAPENPDPCGMQVVARGSISPRPDGSVDVYGINVLGSAAIGGGASPSVVRVAFKRLLTAGAYQVIVTGNSASGKTFNVPRFGKHDGYFDVVVPSDWESFDFVVVGL
jgi:hypothetical protein